jgi:hypothetical protein
MLPLFAQPSLGDLDQDGVARRGRHGRLAQPRHQPAVAVGHNLKGDNLLAVWSGKTGAMLPGDRPSCSRTSPSSTARPSPTSRRHYPEVITGSGGYYLHAYDACGREPAGWPKFTGQWIISTPAFGDLDGDGSSRSRVGTRNGWLYAWHTGGTERPRRAGRATTTTTGTPATTTLPPTSA